MADSKNRPQFVFVYGTLRNDADHEMARLLGSNSTYLGPGVFRGKLYDIGEYPGVVPSSDESDVVRGEVYALHDDRRLLEVLDDYEGCGPEEPRPTEFLRQRHPIRLDSGQTIRAWVYIYNRKPDGLKEIDSGDYMRFKAAARTR